MLSHLFLHKMGSANNSQSPVLILANWHENVLLLEQVNLFGPALHTFVSMADCVPILWRLTHVELVFGWLLQLGEELGVKDVNLFVKWLWDHVVLQKAEVKEDQNVIQVNTGLQKLEVLFSYLNAAIEGSVDQLADHVVFLEIV